MVSFGQLKHHEDSAKLISSMYNAVHHYNPCHWDNVTLL